VRSRCARIWDAGESQRPPACESLKDWVSVLLSACLSTLLSRLRLSCLLAFTVGLGGRRTLVDLSLSTYLPSFSVWRAPGALRLSLRRKPALLRFA
jgi:hypothetical protein